MWDWRSRHEGVANEHLEPTTPGEIGLGLAHEREGNCAHGHSSSNEPAARRETIGSAPGLANARLAPRAVTLLKFLLVRPRQILRRVSESGHRTTFSARGATDSLTLRSQTVRRKLHHVTLLQIDRRFLSHTNARGRAGIYQVSGL